MDNALNVALTDDLRSFCEREARARGFATSGEFVQSLVREARRATSHQRLEELLSEGAASGEPIVADEAFWSRFRSELNSRIRIPKSA